jgi:hypothetical protein
MRRELAEIRKVADLCSEGAPVDPLIEVSLNNDLVAGFLRREVRHGIDTGKCDDFGIPAGTAAALDKRVAQSEKEIAVRVNEAPLGWTLSAATIDWLTRYARREACKLRTQVSGVAPG